MVDNYQFSDILQRISVLLQSDNFSKDYGTGEKYSPVEAHTIGYIADHPGCHSTEIAHAWGKSSSAVSQIISRLKENDLIYILKDEQDKKKKLFYLTDKGHKFDKLHRDFDTQLTESIFSSILDQYSEDDINLTMKVLNKYLEVYCSNKENLKHNKL